MTHDTRANDRIRTERDFEEMSWHDNRVHGLQLVEGEYGSGDLVLDLDYIEEWICNSDRECRFRIVPSHLRFREVTNLRVSLDYAAASAAHGPFSIAGIERREQKHERYVAVLWTVSVNWPEGTIELEAPGFEQRAWGVEMTSDQQCLTPAQRVPR